MKKVHAIKQLLSSAFLGGPNIKKIAIIKIEIL